MRVRSGQVKEIIYMMRRATDGYLPEWCIKSLGKYDRIDSYGYAIRMPITDEWETLYVSIKHVAMKCLPNHVLERLDYWQKMRVLADKMRDYAPMNTDLSPINPEEKALFGLRIMHPNKCFPNTKVREWGQDLNKDYWDKMRGID